VAKLLETRLPIAGREITPDVFNRLVRVLELNLQKFDPNATLQINTEDKLNTKFNPGDIVFDTSKNTLEFFNGEEFEVLSSQPTGSFEATASLGEVSVSEEGSISINVSI
tara:strand:+ start:647 stop:976 length:330 start_codon:yes stop_codon:yes gene_type:complete